MDGLLHPFRLVRAVVLGDNDRRAGGKSDEEADDQIDQNDVRSADGRERGLADIAAEDYGVHRRIQLLQKRAQHDGQEKTQHVFEHRAGRKIGLRHAQPGHIPGRLLSRSSTIILRFRYFSRGVRKKP